MKSLLENWRRFVALHEGIDPETIKKIVKKITDEIQKVQSHGDPNKPGVRLYGEVYIVGGAVRDEIMPKAPPSKDVDFVIRNLTLEQIIGAIKSIGGKPKEVGKEFSVVIATIEGLDFDFALPRKTEEKTGPGHGDVKVIADPFIPIDKDIERRDFTMNAIVKTPDGKIVDNPISRQGIKDIQDGTIRAVGKAEDRFSNDPLRMLRAVQFATRFDFSIESKTLEAIRKNVSEIGTVAGERVLVELEKAWTKGSDNTDKLVSLLKDTDLGEAIFGKDFDPRPVKVSGNAEEKILGNAMAFFMHGGDYTKLRPKKEVVKSIKLARQSISGQEVYEYGGKSRSELSLLAEVLAQIGYKEESEKVLNALLLPLNPVELKISGTEIVNLGLKGPIVGEMQLRLLQAVHAGKVENENDDLLDYLRILVDNNEIPI